MSYDSLIHRLKKIPLYVPKPGYDKFVTSWLICDEGRGQNILFDCGPACSAEKLQESLAELNVKIDYLALSHIHLDHSGGVGQFIKYSPETKIIVHSMGKKHLVNPQRLFEKSRVVLGDLIDVYGEPVGVPESCFADDDFSPYDLTIIKTPGHAPHHLSYVYKLNGQKILFAGEAGGCFYELDNACIFMRPATPYKFFYDDAMRSLDTLLALHDIKLICYSHSGCTRNWKDTLRDQKTQMELWKEVVDNQPVGTMKNDVINAIKEADPVMELLSCLPDDIRKREEYYISNSVDGYMKNKTESLVRKAKGKNI